VTGLDFRFVALPGGRPRLTDAGDLVCAPAMSWAERLFGLEGDTGAEVRTVLEEVHAHVLEQTRRLGVVAGLAPTAASEAELGAIAEEDEAMAGEIQSRLRAISGPGPSATQAPAAASVSGLNHWARVVEVLEQHHGARDLLLEASARLGEIDGEFRAFCERLSRIEEAHITRLRGLIARADPQALD